VAAGDLFAWLASGVKYVVRLVERVATNTWYFLATLGDKTYGCILDCVETVVAAAQWVYMAINTAIEDLLQYLTFLFDWSDITRTKNVIKNLITVFLQNEVQQIDKTREEIDQKFSKAEKFLSDLINEDWTILGDVGRSTANKTAVPTANNSAPGSLLSYPFGLHAQNTKILPSMPTDTPIPAGNSLMEFQQAISREETALNDLATQMTKLGDTAGELSLESLLKSLMAIAVNATLNRIQSIVDKVLNMLKDIACVGMNLLDQPVHIPVVSDILADFGVQSMSLLDVACWMTAIPITVGYKTTHSGNAPFPDTAVTTFLAETTDFAILENMFRPSNPREKILEPNGEDYKAGILLAMPGELPSISDEVRHVLFIVGHEVSGLAALMTTLVGTFEAAAETPNSWSIPAAVLAVMGGGAAGVVTALVPYAPLTQPIMAWISKATTGIRLLSKVGFAGLEKYGVEFDARAAGALVDAALVIPALIVSGWHFAELALLSTDDARTIAIVDETSALTTALARASYAVAVNSQGLAKFGAVGVFAVTNLLTGGLQTAEGILTQP
jgi:hypothetical protein